MTARPVRPRNAASLVLIREGKDGVEVLMGRRAGKHRFLPNLYVYPGGRLDKEDFGAATGAFRPEVAKRLARHAEPRIARALGHAAIRETEEEAGLRVPDISALDYLGRAITPPNSPIRFHARFFMAHAEGAQGTLGGSGELLDLAFRPIQESLKLPIADITEFILGEVGRRLTEAEALAKGLPFFRYFRGRAVITRD
ncbi:MAG: NUDIX hydrolase [Alphaproteobacteria bacterium]|nr:NUDIX hydrolase [Alphaproteobacteria bacterium]